MHDAPEALVLDFLAWLAREPRRYDDAAAVWRTSCPRLPIWEDAFERGLVERQQPTAAAEAAIVLTASGATLLHARRGER